MAINRAGQEWPEDVTHALTRCEQTKGSLDYHYKSYSARFECPQCHRSGKFNLNFLGTRRVICNGTKFQRIDKWEWENLSNPDVVTRT